MDELKVVAPAFVEMAHHIVWCSAATIDQSGRPRSRVLHPVWDWDGTHPPRSDRDESVVSEAR